jgi:hypothetical protein
LRLVQRLLHLTIEAACSYQGKKWVHKSFERSLELMVKVSFLLLADQLGGHHNSRLTGKVDLLEAAGLFGNVANLSTEGVVLRPGPHSASPAAFFLSSVTAHDHGGGGGRKVRMDLGGNGQAAAELRRLLTKKSSELTLMASIKQWQGNSGTLLSISIGSER